MSTNKHAIIRYQTLDKCFSNSGKRYYIEDLLDACNTALFEFDTETNGIKKRQLYDDIRFMESVQGWSIPIEKIKDGRRAYYRYYNTSFSINNQPLNKIEAEQLKSALLVLTRFKGLPQFNWVQELIPKLDKTFNLFNKNDELYKNQVNEREILPNYTRLQSYKDRVESFIRKNKSHLVINKLHKNIPITEQELALLESFLFDEEERTKEGYKREYGDLPLGKFIRTIIGLDIEVVNNLFAEYIQNQNLQPTQISFLNTLINYLNTNGTLDKSLLVKPPFTESHDDGIIGVFSNENDIRKIISIVDLVNNNVIA